MSDLLPTRTLGAGGPAVGAVGLGCMGLQDVFFRLRLPFDSEPARALSKKIAESIYFHALQASCELAE